jgi:hypothetical protein
MRRAIGGMAVLAALALPAAATGQRTPVQQPAAECQPGTGRTPGAGPQGILREYDVVVDVPDLCVRRLHLNVQDLEAHLSLNARVANLIHVQAGADVQIGEVDLTIQGVRAQALLLVDLDNVVYVVDRALTFIDDNPQIVSQLTGTLNTTLQTVGGVANQALRPGGVVDQTVGVAGQTLNNVTQPGGVLSQTVNTLGQTVQRTVDAAGTIVERTLDTTGNVVNTRTIGRLLDLPVVTEAVGAGGRITRQVRDQSGALIEYVLDSAGRVVSSRVVSGGPAPR